ncbi:MAG TPA: hypothetical protein VLQ80_29280 [Candidatus Saccharimonadia bacterium]|nr:hypothetical protein [Candidatus Saccharimonadia bacterium]
MMHARCDEAPCPRAGRWAFQGAHYCLRHVTEHFTAFAEGVAARTAVVGAYPRL